MASTSQDAGRQETETRADQQPRSQAHNGVTISINASGSSNVSGITMIGYQQTNVNKRSRKRSRTEDGINNLDCRVTNTEDTQVNVKKVPKEAKSSTPQQQSQHVESTEPPSVFISYQWDKQPEIKRLFSRLTGLGYHCWLDINQMGGGDPLYSKIDEGIRNAKIVISCVTPEYALSANCINEVSLADALRKPIIPLLLEEMPCWPPKGPMSMTFTQLLYINFTKESTQASFDDEKFDELVKKIKEHAQPTLELLQNRTK